jgi:uncharacterized protein
MGLSNAHSELPVLLAGEINMLDDDCACSEMRIAWTNTTNIVQENDCACVPAQVGLKGEAGSDLYQMSRNIFTLALPNNFLLALPVESPTGPVVLNKAAWDELQKFKNPHPVMEPIERKMLQSGLLDTALSSEYTQKNIPQNLTAWLHLTDACNLDCPYCYIRKSQGCMSFETGRNVLAKVFETARNQNLSHVKLKYAGGEATLQFNLIRSLHEEAMTRALSQKIGLTEVILTNGILLDKIDIDWIREAQIRLMISMDGVGIDHDQMRSTRQGQGTFAHIEKIIDTILLPRKIHPTISVTITRYNADRVDQIVRWTLQRNLPISLNFYRIQDMDKSIEAISCDEDLIIAGMQSAYKVVEELLPEHPFINGLLDRVRFSAHQKTCAVGEDYLVFNTDGHLADCHMLIDPVDIESKNCSSTRIHNLSVDQKLDCQ